jgi:hypothetical protein
MSLHETPAVKAERYRREDQDKLWDKARAVTRKLIDTNSPESWITTSEFIRHIQEESGVSRGVAIAVMQEFRDNGEVVYTLSQGYKKSIEEPEDGLRPEDVRRRNDFLSFVDAMYKIENKEV